MSTVPVEAKPNPYVTGLADRFFDSSIPAAQRFYEEYIVPKNKKIHALSSELMKLQASLHKLDKVLAVHNAGVCKDGEPPVDCAIRLLSPVPDSMPQRDRP